MPYAVSAVVLKISVEIHRIIWVIRDIHKISCHALNQPDHKCHLCVCAVRPLIAYTFPFVKVIAGETAELECVVLLGKPVPTLSWLRKGQLLRQSPRVKLTDPGHMVISDAREEDEGEYVCLATNIGGNETYTVNLDVLGILSVCAHRHLRCHKV